MNSWRASCRGKRALPTMCASSTNIASGSTDLNLFDSLAVKPDTGTASEAGAAPIAVDAHERPPHSVGLGVKYATDTGPGGKASWENRNLWGHAEDLKLALELARSASRSKSR